MLKSSRPKEETRSRESGEDSVEKKSVVEGESRCRLIG